MNHDIQHGMTGIPRVCVCCCELQIPQEIMCFVSGAELDAITVSLPAKITPNAIGTTPLAFDAYVIDGHFGLESICLLVDRIYKLDKNARVLVISEKFTESDALVFLQNGVSGIAPYAHLGKQLAIAVHTVASGGFWVPRQLMLSTVDKIRTSQSTLPWLPSEQLEPEDRELLQLLLEDRSNEEIAIQLRLSVSAAKYRISQVLSSFNVGRRSDLILYWYQTQILGPSKYRELWAAN